MEPRGPQLKNFDAVERVVKLPSWLREHEPGLYAEVYAADDVVLDDLQQAAQSLGIEDVDLHAARIRRGLEDDPEQAIGSAKELLESVLKAILGLHGNGPETQLEIPALVARASQQLGLDPGGIRASNPGTNERRRMLGSLILIVQITAELRNAGFDTGHGGSRRKNLDTATARLVVSAAVTFYLETFETSQRG